MRPRRSPLTPASWAGTRPLPLWLDDAGAPEQRPALSEAVRADLAVVGGGFTGLRAALRAASAEPGRRVVLVEGARVGWAASGRNGGFVEASLTHGLANGVARFPDEMATLERLGAENLAALIATCESEQIACDLEQVATIECATAPWQRDELAQAAALARRYGHDVELLDAATLRARIDSPTYLGGMRSRGRSALVNPARLAWGLAAAAERHGVRIYEESPIVALAQERSGAVRLRGRRGEVRADRVVLATNAFPPFIASVARRVLPVYDYVLATEPIDPPRLAEIGWREREGLSDGGNRFHYYRLSADNRLVFGGFDAIYHYGNALHEGLAQRPATFQLLAEHVVATFPPLEGIGFTHAWGGAIDTCARFCAFFTTAQRGRVAQAAGFTGLGVGASRFAAGVLLDLLDGRTSEATELAFVRSRPVPFPPEPLRSAVVNLTRWSLARADENEGRRNLWLRGLDALGLGFDS